MTSHAWIKEFPAAVTVCDAEGIILEMNDKSAKTFEADGGYNLIGSNMLDCHPGQSHQKVERLLDDTFMDRCGVHRPGWLVDVPGN